MPPMPVLAVVPLDSLRRHEEVDPLRVKRLLNRIRREGIQVNPMVCVRAEDEQLVLLDGATRTESLKGIGLRDAVVQLVEPDSVTLETWHHVIRGCESGEVITAIGEQPDLLLSDDEGTPCVHVGSGVTRQVLGAGMSPNATLSSLVAGYVGRWTVARAIDPGTDHINASFPDWAAIVEFPRLTMDDVMKAAVTDDLLPAGITRFLVPDRALRLNVPLSLLEEDTKLAAKQEALDELLAERATEGRIRRYEEPVFILDD